MGLMPFTILPEAVGDDPYHARPEGSSSGSPNYARVEVPRNLSRRQSGGHIQVVPFSAFIKQAAVCRIRNAF